MYNLLPVINSKVDLIFGMQNLKILIHLNSYFEVEA